MAQREKQQECRHDDERQGSREERMISSIINNATSSQFDSEHHHQQRSCRIRYFTMYSKKSVPFLCSCQAVLTDSWYGACW